MIQNRIGADSYDVLNRAEVAFSLVDEHRVFNAYLHWCHETRDMLVTQFQNTVEDADFIIPEWFFALTVKLQERSVYQNMSERHTSVRGLNLLELCLFVGRHLAFAKGKVEQFRSRPGDRRCNFRK